MTRSRRAADELRKTVVVVLHDINFASCHSDRIVAMQDGRVFRQGTPDEIVRPDVLEEIYGASFAVQRIGGRNTATYFS